MVPAGHSLEGPTFVMDQSPDVTLARPTITKGKRQGDPAEGTTAAAHIGLYVAAEPPSSAIR